MDTFLVFHSKHVTIQVTFTHSHTLSHTDSGGCHAGSQPTHQKDLIIHTPKAQPLGAVQG